MLKFPLSKDFDEHFQSPIWFDAAKEICRRHRISFGVLQRSASSDHIVFLIDERLVLKIYRPARNCFERETKALDFFGGKTDLRIPEVVLTGALENFDYVLMTQMAGASLTRGDWLKLPENEQTSFVVKVARGLKQIHELNADSFDDADGWAKFIKDRAETFVERQIAHGVNFQIIKELPAFIEENLQLVPVNPPFVLMHADVHFGNLRVAKNLEITGLFDFADSRKGFHEYEFLAVGVLMIQGQGKLQREFFKAYGYAESELDDVFRRRLMMLAMLYETSDLRRYALRLKPEAVNYGLEKLEKSIWSFAGSS